MSSDRTETGSALTAFPQALFAWGNASNKAVCCCSDESSGWQKPSLRTHLIDQLDELSQQIKTGVVKGGASVFLVGGPGNGKTHAAKYFQKNLFGCEYAPSQPDAKGVISYKVDNVPSLKNVRFVEDASAAASQDLVFERLVEDIESYTLHRPEDCLFVCCINRGVLASALARIEKKLLTVKEETAQFISYLSAVVSPDSSPVPLWPIEGYDGLYVHPMDEESLLEPIADRGMIATEIVKEICNVDSSACTNCSSSGCCPILANLKMMQNDESRDSLLRVLRYYEIVSSKRLSFRDLFSIISSLIVGNQNEYVNSNGKSVPVCEWIRKRTSVFDNGLRDERIVASFELASALCANRLFPNWSDFKRVDRKLLKSIKAAHSKTIANTFGLFKVLASKVRRSASVTSQDYLFRCGLGLDPASQDTSTITNLNADISNDIRKVEDAFCKSLSLGVETFAAMNYASIPEAAELFMKECRQLEQSEDILDMSVSDPEYQLSQTVFSALRILLSRVAKRILGLRYGLVYQGTRLEEYRTLLNGTSSDAARKRRICNTVQNYLFPEGIFQHSMLATFGQAEPDDRMAFLLKSKAAPRFSFVPTTNAAIKNLLFIKDDSLNLMIKVNFDLYSAICDLQQGLTPASLPERIYDVLDGVKTRVQGYMCHHWDEGAMSFSFFDKKDRKRIVQWNAEEGFYEEA